MGIIKQTSELEAMLRIIDARAYLLQMYKPETGSIPQWLNEADNILIQAERQTRRAAMMIQLSGK